MYNAHLLYILHRIQLQNKNIQTMKKIHIILILALLPVVFSACTQKIVHSSMHRKICGISTFEGYRAHG